MMNKFCQNIGLKRGTVYLVPHQEEWCENAKIVIAELKDILGNTAIDIQHVGSTAISSIHAKPIIDIAVGVKHLNDVKPYIELLGQIGIIYRSEDVARQLLFVIGDFENDTRTHHIHIVKWNGEEWCNYINFRDYLNSFEERALAYDKCKQKLAEQFSHDRLNYTEGKRKLINQLLQEARAWRENHNFI